MNILAKSWIAMQILGMFVAGNKKTVISLYKLFLALHIKAS